MSDKVFDATPFIRGIQLSEGNHDCFGRAVGGCDQKNCAWRKFCIDKKPLPNNHLSVLYHWMLTEK